MPIFEFASREGTPANRYDANSDTGHDAPAS